MRSRHSSWANAFSCKFTTVVLCTSINEAGRFSLTQDELPRTHIFVVQVISTCLGVVWRFGTPLGLALNELKLGCSSFKFKYYLRACTTRGKIVIISYAKQPMRNHMWPTPDQKTQLGWRSLNFERVTTLSWNSRKSFLLITSQGLLFS